MDGLRKVPGNVPNPEMLRAHIGQPLTKVPDPFEKFESFAHYNNAKLREFLDSFGFEYEFTVLDTGNCINQGSSIRRCCLLMLKHR